jgi:hypothetical protein
VKYIPSLRLIDAIYLSPAMPAYGDVPCWRLAMLRSPTLAGYRAQFTVRRGIYRAGRYIRFTHMATLAALSLDGDAPWLALLHSTCTGAIQCSHDKNDLGALHCVPPAQ